jgi:hypothetical protein
MGANYSRRFGSSATKVATRDSPNSFRHGVSQKQRPASDLRVARRTTTPGNYLEGIETTVAAGGGGAVEQSTRRVDQPSGANRRYSEATVPWFRCHAQAGFWFSRDRAPGQGNHPRSLDGRGAQDRYDLAGSLGRGASLERDVW